MGITVSRIAVSPDRSKIAIVGHPMPEIEPDVEPEVEPQVEPDVAPRGLP